MLDANDSASVYRRKDGWVSSFRGFPSPDRPVKTQGTSMPWPQPLDPLGNPWLSTGVAAIPVIVLLGLVAWGHLRVGIAALLALGAALGVALLAFGMPVPAALGAAAYGGAYGLFPIGWIVLNVMFLHALTVKSGLFQDLKGQLMRVAPDPRVQVILIAFCFGAFIEGAAGFGAPVAITAALLLQLGFSPIHASGLSLIANTAPVAFGSIGIPITTLAQVTDLDVMKLSQMAGRQLPVFSTIIPLWIVGAMAGWRGIREVWPVALVAGVSFAVMQFLVSNYHGPWLVDSISALVSLGAVLWMLRWRQRKESPALIDTPVSASGTRWWRPWVPWLILTLAIFAWGTRPVKETLDRLVSPSFPVPGIHQQVMRTPPVVRVSKVEKVELKLNVLSATGTGIWLAAVVSGLLMGYSPRQLLRVWWDTLMAVRQSLLTIAAMLALGNVTKLSGADATLGMALAKTGVFYPFFGTLLGWLGVALTGSDTASNVLFGSLQRITAEQLGLSPYLMCAANSTGGVMGKMIDAQSIVVAGVAVKAHGEEGKILRFVFWHSLVLAALISAWVAAQAYWPLLQSTVVR
jgi:lactate permease